MQDPKAWAVTVETKVAEGWLIDCCEPFILVLNTVDDEPPRVCPMCECFPVKSYPVFASAKITERKGDE